MAPGTLGPTVSLAVQHVAAAPILVCETTGVNRQPETVRRASHRSLSARTHLRCCIPAVTRASFVTGVVVSLEAAMPPGNGHDLNDVIALAIAVPLLRCDGYGEVVGRDCCPGFVCSASGGSPRPH